MILDFINQNDLYGYFGMYIAGSFIAICLVWSKIWETGIEAAELGGELDLTFTYILRCVSLVFFWPLFVVYFVIVGIIVWPTVFIPRFEEERQDDEGDS